MFKSNKVRPPFFGFPGIHAAIKSGCRVSPTRFKHKKEIKAKRCTSVKAAVTASDDEESLNRLVKTVEENLDPKNLSIIQSAEGTYLQASLDGGSGKCDEIVKVRHIKTGPAKNANDTNKSQEAHKPAAANPTNLTTKKPEQAKSAEPLASQVQPRKETKARPIKPAGASHRKFSNTSELYNFNCVECSCPLDKNGNKTGEKCMYCVSKIGQIEEGTYIMPCTYIRFIQE